MIADRSYEQLSRYAWWFQKLGFGLFGCAVVGSVWLVLCGTRVGIDVGGVPLVWTLLGMQALMGGQFLHRQARLQAKIDMLTIHKAQRFAAGQGKHIYLGSGDTCRILNSCGHEVTIRAHSAAHLEIG